MPVDPFPEQRPLRELYLLLMEELKRKRNLVADIVAQKYPLPIGISLELRYLQLRMICELIALGCLAAHGDIPATRSGKMQKAWSPGTILPELEKLHWNFYPIPGKQIKLPDGKIRIDKVTTPYLTTDELLKLYAECGDRLHRGSMRTIDRPFSPHDFNKIAEWDKKITTLLSHHQIQLLNPKYQMWVIMQASDDGRSSAWIEDFRPPPVTLDK